MIAAAVAGHAQQKRLQIFVDAKSECVRLDLALRFDLPPLAIHAQAPVVSHLDAPSLIDVISEGASRWLTTGACAWIASGGRSNLRARSSRTHSDFASTKICSRFCCACPATAAAIISWPANRLGRSARPARRPRRRRRADASLVVRDDQSRAI